MKAQSDSQCSLSGYGSQQQPPVSSLKFVCAIRSHTDEGVEHINCTIYQWSSLTHLRHISLNLMAATDFQARHFFARKFMTSWSVINKLMSEQEHLQCRLTQVEQSNLDLSTQVRNTQSQHQRTVQQLNADFSSQLEDKQSKFESHHQKAIDELKSLNERLRQDAMHGSKEQQIQIKQLTQQLSDQTELRV